MRNRPAGPPPRYRETVTAQSATHPRDTAAGRGPLLPRTGRVVLVLCALLYAASLIVTATAFPDGLVVSADAGVPQQPLWEPLIGPMTGIVVVLLFMRMRPRLPAVPGQSSALVGSIAMLVGLLTIYLLAPTLLSVSSEEQVLLKALLLMLVPGLAIWLWSRRSRSVHILSAAGAWRWWMPALAVAVYLVLSQLMPWVSPWDPGEIPLELVIIGALVTAITAGIGEELFFRFWLQTRLEALLGAPAGIALASTAFGLMHLVSHGSGNVLLDIAQVMVVQGTFGVFLGILWWRFRNLWLAILAHLIANGWAVVVWLVTQA